MRSPSSHRALRLLALLLVACVASTSSGCFTLIALNADSDDHASTEWDRGDYAAWLAVDVAAMLLWGIFISGDIHTELIPEDGDPPPPE